LHVVTVFTDPLCTACRVTLKKILKPLDKDIVRVVYKFWPRNPAAVEGGLIMQLAHQEGKGALLLNALLDNESPLTDLDMLGMLDTAGINLSVQRALLAEGSSRLTEQLGRDIAQARNARFASPPVVVLNDYVLDGRILYPERIAMYVERLNAGQALVQGNDYWLNSGE
jgi:predicted DsbA family dithiol-disulfide isomerase